VVSVVSLDVKVIRVLLVNVVLKVTPVTVVQKVLVGQEALKVKKALPVNLVQKVLVVNKGFLGQQGSRENVVQ
jgi:hypothetical protein